MGRGSGKMRHAVLANFRGNEQGATKREALDLAVEQRGTKCLLMLHRNDHAVHGPLLELTLILVSASACITATMVARHAMNGRCASIS